MIKEFKEFAMKGNVVDLAVGVIIGGAFGKIVDSMVNDIIMPLVSKVLLRGISFTDKFVSLDGNVYPTYAKAKEAGGAIFAYGNFVQIIVNFIIVAFVLFLFIKAMNHARKKEAAPAAAPEPTTSEKLLMEIRDSLKK
ncbi:MAG: mscL [Bacteroidetes bacterium]|nr:mscL [Bacteroidota bacterium]